MCAYVFSLSTIYFTHSKTSTFFYRSNICIPILINHCVFLSIKYSTHVFFLINPLCNGLCWLFWVCSSLNSSAFNFYTCQEYESLYVSFLLGSVHVSSLRSFSHTRIIIYILLIPIFMHSNKPSLFYLLNLTSYSFKQPPLRNITLKAISLKYASCMFLHSY